MKVIQKSVQYAVVMASLLLAIWSQSWLLTIIVFVACLLLWRPSFRIPLSLIKQKLSPLHYKITEWAITLAMALFAIWFANTYFVNIFSIGSTSMQPAYNSGDLIVINKLAYGPAINANNCDKYRRLAGYSKIGRGDIIAFHFPEADTAFAEHEKEDYYLIKRQYENTKSYNPLLSGEVIYNEVTKRKAFVKRVIALPGDTLKIANGDYYINNRAIACNKLFVNKYRIASNVNTTLKNELIEKALTSYREKGEQIIEIQQQNVDDNNWNNYLTKVEDPLNMPNIHVFPFKANYFWNASHLGPIILPTKGKTVQLTLSNLPIYKRIIESYEENKIRIVGDRITINGKLVKEYTFKLNYYWVAGDNKTRSFDSRYWGFVPENHIIGRAIKL